VRFVYDVQDLWPESALASGLLRPGHLVNLLYRLADWVYARAPRILVVSDAAARHLHQRGVDPAKIAVAPHWVDTGSFERPSSRDVRAEFRWDSRFIVMFAGNLGMVQGLETVIDAAALLRDRRDVLFVLVGDGSDRARLESMVAERQLTNVQFAGRHPADAMPDFFRAADALLVHLRPSPIADHAVPTKILSYLAAARPIVCATGGAAADLVRAANAGPIAPPGDAAALAAAIVDVASMPIDARQTLGDNGRAYLHAHFDKQTVIDGYERALAEVGRA
jgi:glycosyltransferase involved in cell wall biosynthesis